MTLVSNSAKRKREIVDSQFQRVLGAQCTLSMAYEKFVYYNFFNLIFYHRDSDSTIFRWNAHNCEYTCTIYIQILLATELNTAAIWCA